MLGMSISQDFFPPNSGKPPWKPIFESDMMTTSVHILSLSMRGLAMLEEEIARIRVNEAIQKGLQPQAYQRNLPRRRKPVSKAFLLVLFLSFFLVLALSACSGPATATGATQPTPAVTMEPAAPAEFNFTVSADAISVPNGIPTRPVGLG